MPGFYAYLLPGGQLQTQADRLGAYIGRIGWQQALLYKTYL
jgi:hypothetical protein